MGHKLLITGATGFVGRGLTAQLMVGDAFRLRLAVRSTSLLPDLGTPLDSIEVGNVDGNTRWDSALEGVQIVVHLAARAHVLRDTSKDPLEAFRETNLYGTRRLAQAAAAHGVKRFVYISSIGVNGLQTVLNQPFGESDVPHPHNAYAISKWEAEQALVQVSQASGMEIVIIRPPLVYGAGAPGNFAQLLKMVAFGVPLPLASINNLRSFVSLDNLADFIRVCCLHPKAANQTFLIADGHDLSTPDLIAGIARGLQKKVSLFPVPLWMLRFGAKLLRQGGAEQRLCGSLQIDISKARQCLEWTPPVSVEEGLRRATAQWKKNEALY